VSPHRSHWRWPSSPSWWRAESDGTADGPVGSRSLLEGLVALGSALLWLLPVGAMRGPVPLLINLVLPAAVLAILLTRGVRQRAIIPSP